MLLTIVSPERRVVDKLPVASVTLPGVEGQIQILDGHADFLGLLETGPFAYSPVDQPARSGVISFGYFRITGSLIEVVSETLEYAEEIDLERARKAQKAAETVLSGKSASVDTFRKQELKLQRALIRQHSAAIDTGRTK
jgi:F-type H+-transporting ATPase subunit epsilon